MKNRILAFLISVFFLGSLFGQGQPSVQVQWGLNFTDFSFSSDFVDPAFMQDIPERAHLGYTIGLLGELPINRQQFLLFGVASTQINHFPKLDYGLWYGLVVQKDGEQIYLSPSYLERLRFDLLEIPLSWRYYLNTGAKINPYFGFGMTTSFSWRERERWKSMLEPASLINVDNGQIHEYEAVDKNFRHFRTGFSLNLGSSFRINSRFRFIIDVQTHFVELRRAQNSLVTDWVPAFWETGGFYPGQFSVNVGLQRNL